MLIVVSDVHMTDRAVGAPVRDWELDALVRHVESLEPRKEGLTLLLLGDIIDFLRSGEWDRLWEEENGAAPWSSLGPGFEGFQGSLQEKRLLAVAAGVERRYPAFATALKKLKNVREAQIHYVVGNHDYMLQLSPSLRARVVKFLSLDEDPTKEFPRRV